MQQDNKKKQPDKQSTRKHTKREEFTHLWQFESLDRVNRAMQGTNDLEQVMKDVLDSLLSVFECDRAWLVYPCDPDSPTWQVSMERTRPEYPGVLPIGVELPLDPVGAEVYRILRNTDGPVKFGDAEEHRVPKEMQDGFSVQSFIAMAFYPKIGMPWSFGLHQCSYARVWTFEEERLFQEIGRRLSDTLNTLLTYRDLQESEEKYRTLIQKIGAAVVVHGADTQILTSNSMAQELLGLTEDQMLGKTSSDAVWNFLFEDGTAIPPEKYPVNQVLGSHKPLRNFVAGVHRPENENDVWVLVNADPIFSKEGYITQVVVTFIDITERKRVDDELQKNREGTLQFSEQLATLQDVTNELSKSESSDDLCLQAVQLGRSRLGFDRVSIWFIDERLGIMRGSFGTDERGDVRDERNAQVEFRHEGLAWILFSNRESMALVEHRPLFDHLGREVGKGENALAALWNGGEVSGVICVDNLLTGRSIDERQLEVLRLYATTLGHLIIRKQAEEALRASENRFRVLSENAFVGIYIIQDGRLSYVNSTLAKIFGYSPDELIGAPPALVIHPDDRSMVSENIRRRLTGEIETIHYEFRGLYKSGEIKNIEVLGGRVEFGGKPAVIGNLMDITDRKRAETEIRNINQELEQRVVERTAQLEAANKELEAFAYSISHDLRAPLRHIDGFIELLEKRIKSSADEKSQHYMSNISDAAKRMGLLIDDLLSFSRMGRQEMSNAQVDIGDLVREVIRELEPETRGRNINWHITEIPMVRGDLGMLKIVLVNLISNALKFTRPRQQVEIEISYIQDLETEVVIFIRDNGVGFDMNYADKLFGVFHRLHRQEDFDGTGIGLANVRRIISRHGGKTWAEGKVGHGATFYFSLPISRKGKT